MKRLGILLTVGPKSIGFSALLNFLNQRQELKEATYFYGIDAGVLVLTQMPSLSRTGYWHVYGCAFSARQYEVTINQEEVVLCGLSVLADILGNVDEMVGVIDREPYLVFSKVKYDSFKKRKVLIEITNDPRLDKRALEGMRIAAGVKAWNQVELEMSFSEKGVALLAQNKVSFFESEGVIQEVLFSNEIKFWLEAEILQGQKISSDFKVKILNSREVLKQKNEAWFILTF